MILRNLAFRPGIWHSFVFAKKKRSFGRRVSFFPDENCCYSCWGFKCTCKCKQRWNQVFIDRRSSSGKSLEDSESGFRFIIRERMTRPVTICNFIIHRFFERLKLESRIFINFIRRKIWKNCKRLRKIYFS